MPLYFSVVDNFRKIMEVESEQKENDDGDGNNSDKQRSAHSVILPELLLQTEHVFYKGRRYCVVCSIGSGSKNARRAGIERITDIKKFKDQAIKWKDYDHEYNKIYENIIGQIHWNFTVIVSVRQFF